jgi:hypothetical protein
MSATREQGLLAWQWGLYAEGHRDRRNLVVHILTVPVFQLGSLTLLLAPVMSGWLAVAGLGAMVGAMALQGRTHRLEAVPPVPFSGPLDVLARIVVEQWVTFPRFVLSGGFARAWRGHA